MRDVPAVLEMISMLSDHQKTGSVSGTNHRIEDRLLSLSLYGALAFIAALIIATLPHATF
jgi:hypothetical protein